MEAEWRIAGRLTLKVALSAISIAGEGGLGFLILQSVENLAVCDVAHLVILVDDGTLAVAHTIFSFWHHGIAGVVCLADIAVYTLPTFFALTFTALTWKSVAALW